MQAVLDFFGAINIFLNRPEFLQAFANDRFLLILLTIILVRVKYASYESFWVSALVNVPGTFLHELCHYIIGLITFAEPSGFSVWPKKNEDGSYTLGSVGLYNINFFNAIPAALAPLLLLPLGYWCNRNLLPALEPTFVNYILYVLAQTIIIENSVPSQTDFKVAFKYPLGILFYGFIFTVLGVSFYKGFIAMPLM